MSTWIFQGSLKYFDINTYVANGGNINWHVKAKKHQDEIKVGDRVFIWRTEGKDKNPGGIIAYTKVIKPAYFDDESKQFKVDLEVIESRLDEESNMLLRSNLKECVRTKFLTILRSPQGTNFYCSDEEGEALLSFWNNPSLLKEEISKNIIDQYLSIYKKEANNYLKNCELVKVNYEFFSNFKAEENLENLNWEEIQQIGEHLNSLSMGIARKRALGRPNASIEKYRESFKYLFYSKDSLKEKINNFLDNDEYKLFGLGVSVISEIFGYVFADEVCFFNLRDEVAVKEIFNIDLNHKRGDNFGEKYEKFQRALRDNDIVEKYLTIVGRKTTLPVYLELDQFFSYVYEKYSKYIKVEEEPIDEAEDSTVINEAAGIEYSNEVNIEEYNIEDFLREIFIDREEAEELIELLEYKNNIILQGPPGVGKTFIGKRIAYLHSGFKDSSKVKMVQFHQSYSYEDFVRGLRPNENGGFQVKDGIFYELCKEAIKEPNKNFYLIIDEINRGNLSKIFGELLMLIEKDKRGIEYGITMTYSKEGENKFYVPKNLYIIGTMNTADRSLSLVDYALRRRFSFIDIEPAFNKATFKEFLISRGIGEELILKIIDSMTNLNKEIENDDIELGKGYKIGHSYFCNIDNLEDEQKWYERIIKFEIKPLLEQYWFDNTKKVSDLIERIK
ncbi:AAA family ATPase [Clostridium sp.]|uniref:AAA family ATPase n=1 Tax=Clostridium sp. TaxID=1506 RepID=UPI0025C2B035|nr:AAA family ATPase [Clostridium sp.]